MILVEINIHSDLANQLASKTEKYVLGPPSASQRHAKEILAPLSLKQNKIYHSKTYYSKQMKNHGAKVKGKLWSACRTTEIEQT
jgi:hypothetical protein